MGQSQDREGRRYVEMRGMAITGNDLLSEREEGL